MSPPSERRTANPSERRSASPTAFTLGQHDTAIKTLLERTTRIELEVHESHVILAEWRGERRLAVWFVGAAAGIIGAVFTAIIRYLAKAV